MQLLFGLLAGIVAFAIAAVAGFFSITGMTALFAAAYWPVVTMMVVLEAGKLTAAGWLHAHWRSLRVSLPHKVYLALAIVALMLITAIGIYGFLAKGFLDQQVPSQAMSLQIAQREQQIAVARTNLADLTARQGQLDAAVNSLITQNFVLRSQAVRTQQRQEREQIASEIKTTQQAIEQQTSDLLPMQMAANTAQAKLGPVKYVADLFGWTQPDIAVRMVILTLMFAFDPLAVALVIASSISLGEWLNKDAPAVPVPSVSDSDPPIIHLDPHVDAATDKQTVLAILRRNPDVVEDVLDTVLEWHGQHR